MCSHCCALTDVLTTGPATADLAFSTTAWTLATLQQVVQQGSVHGTSGFLSNLSSTALCNLLVLLELNSAALCGDTLALFLQNINGLPFAKKEEWCWFLMQHVRERVGIASDLPLELQTEGTAQQHLLTWVEEDSDMETMEEGEEEDRSAERTGAADFERSSCLSTPLSPGKADMSAVLPWHHVCPHADPDTDSSTGRSAEAMGDGDDEQLSDHLVRFEVIL